MGNRFILRVPIKNKSVPFSDQHVRDALKFAAQVSPTDSRSLIAPDESYMSVLLHAVRPVRDVLHT